MSGRFRDDDDPCDAVGSGGRRWPWRASRTRQGRCAYRCRRSADARIWTRPSTAPSAASARREAATPTSTWFPATANCTPSMLRTAPTWCRRSPFLPPGAKAVGLILIDTVLYAATTDCCGGAPNALWAIELANDANSRDQLAAEGRDRWGRSCLLVPDGTIYLATGAGESPQAAAANSIVALDPKTLKLKSSFTAPRPVPFTTSPIVLASGDKTLVRGGLQRWPHLRRRWRGSARDQYRRDRRRGLGNQRSCEIGRWRRDPGRGFGQGSNSAWLVGGFCGNERRRCGLHAR